MDSLKKQPSNLKGHDGCITPCTLHSIQFSPVPSAGCTLWSNVFNGLPSSQELWHVKYSDEPWSLINRHLIQLGSSNRYATHTHTHTCSRIIQPPHYLTERFDHLTGIGTPIWRRHTVTSDGSVIYVSGTVWCTTWEKSGTTDTTFVRTSFYTSNQPDGVQFSFECPQGYKRQFTVHSCMHASHTLTL
jgi:hypothetical protein